MTTIYDVAKAAAVSPKTVSRVLNGDAPVGQKTRQAVENAIDDLGYIPSHAARSMRSNKTGLVGLITGALSQSLEPMEPTGLPSLFIVQGIQKALTGSGKTLMIADTAGDSANISKLVGTFIQHRVEALIYVADYHREVSLDVGKPGCPLILVNCFDKVNTTAVVPDDEYCQYTLTQSLIEAGHKRIAYFSLSGKLVATELRTKGYRQALNEAGIEHDKQLELIAREQVHSDDGTQLQQALNAMLTLDKPPTAICCGNDEMALRLYGLVRSRGMRVPEDISIAGFDNYRAIAETLYPPLTTVELPYTSMGQQAAKMALQQIESADKTFKGPMKVSGPVHWRSSVSANHHAKT